ncbi:MAG: histidine kinase [Flavobacteriaceae bacterium]|nr:histidine kinase [Flavobacteriaceae bacterium]
MIINQWFKCFVLTLIIGCYSPIYSQFEKGIDIGFTIFHSSLDTTSVETLLTRQALFKNQLDLRLKTTKQDSYWLKIDFSQHLNTLDKDSLWFLYTRKFLESTLYFADNGTISKKDYGFLNRNKSQEKNEPINGVFFSKNNLIDGHYLLLKIRKLAPGQKSSKLKIELVDYNQYITKTHFFTSEDINRNIPVYLFVGAFLFIFIFSLITYFTSKRFDFLFYSLYILSLLIYLGKSAFGIEEYINKEITLIAFWIHSVIQILINLFYVAFAKYYLNTSENYPKLNRAINGISYVLFGFIIVSTLTVFSTSFDLHLKIMNIHRLVMSIFAIAAFIYLFLYAKNTLAYFIIFGSLAFLAGSLIMLFTLDKNYMIIGAAIEVLLFGLGLNYKLKMANQEKILLEHTAYENKISALRAQMNPHFIFNSLNSIQHLIISDKKEAAIKYLNKFSLLMRNLLESSIEKNILLSEEINLLNKYLELESLRFDNAFEFSIEVHKNLDPDVVEVPILIVQPFIENALLHGLLSKKEDDKKLHVLFRKEENNLVCEIDDNGIGREASQKLKPFLKSEKKSRGIEVTQKRLQIQNEGDDNNITIIDKVDENGEAAGTKVIIKIQID